MLLKSGCRITHTHIHTNTGCSVYNPRATLYIMARYSNKPFSFSLIKKRRGKHKGGEIRTENKVNHLIFTAKTKRLSNHAERQSAAFCPCIPSTFADCSYIKYLPVRAVGHMNYECLSKRLKPSIFFYLQFKGLKSFGAVNYSYIQMNLTLRMFFFLLLFHEFRVCPAEGERKKNCKVLLMVKFGVGSCLGRLSDFWAYACALVVELSALLGVVWDSPSITLLSLIVILDKCSPIRLLSSVCVCVDMWVCHWYASVCSFCSTLSDLWRSLWLARHRHETKSGSVLHIYWFQNLSNVTNNFLHLGDKGTLPPRD